MAFNKASLGNRYVCFECEVKFYDLNKDPICPSCSADQRENPNPDAREAFLASLSTRGRKKAVKEEPKKEEELTEERPAPKKRASRKSPKKAQFIDGKQLTKKEIEFQEYSNKKFNTEKWLKKNGLIL